jgi:type II secretory pathway component PulF
MFAPNDTPMPFRIRAELFAQLAQMEEAGLPFDRALRVLRLPMPFLVRIDALGALIAKGAEFPSAGEQSALFTKLESRLIRAAMDAGSPAKTYQRLAGYYTDRAVQLAAMKSRLMLPALMFLLALIIQPLPALVRGSLSMPGYLWRVSYPVLSIGALIVGIRALARGEARTSGKSIYRRLPLYGPIFVRRNLRDFFQSLGLMLEAGVSMADALPVAADTVEDGDIRRQLLRIRPRIAKGSSLAEAMRGIGYLEDARLHQFVRTGEASGELPQMLMRHTRFETESINSSLEQLTLWVPRAIYGIVALWMAYGLLTSSGFLPGQLP